MIPPKGEKYTVEVQLSAAKTLDTFDVFAPSRRLAAFQAISYARRKHNLPEGTALFASTKGGAK